MLDNEDILSKHILIYLLHGMVSFPAATAGVSSVFFPFLACEHFENR